MLINSWEFLNMKLRLIFTEDLPRRFSCQSIEMSRKNIENTFKHLYFLQGSPLEKVQFFNFTIDLVFHLSYLETFNIPTHSRFSVPFSFKPSQHNFSISKQRTDCKKLKKSNCDPVQILGGNKLKRKLTFFSNFHYFKQKFFCFIENFSSKYFSPFSINWKGRERNKWKKINKMAISRLIKLVSFIYLNKIKSSSFGIKIERKNCQKHVINNIVQTIGGVFDSLFEKEKKIYQISLKALNFPEIIFFSSLS